MYCLRGETQNNKSPLSFLVKQWLQTQHQVFMYVGLWFLSLKQVFLNKIRFIVLIMGRAMFLGILLKELTEENIMFSMSYFLCKEHSLRTLLRDYTGVICVFFISLRRKTYKQKNVNSSRREESPTFYTEHWRNPCCSAACSFHSHTHTHKKPQHWKSSRCLVESQKICLGSGKHAFLKYARGVWWKVKRLWNHSLRGHLTWPVGNSQTPELASSGIRLENAVKASSKV